VDSFAPVCSKWTWRNLAFGAEAAVAGALWALSGILGFSQSGRIPLAVFSNLKVFGRLLFMVFWMSVFWWLFAAFGTEVRCRFGVLGLSVEVLSMLVLGVSSLVLQFAIQVPQLAKQVPQLAKRVLQLSRRFLPLLLKVAPQLALKFVWQAVLLAPVAIMVNLTFRRGPGLQIELVERRSRSGCVHRCFRVCD
jgi:hypothetical protein